MLAARRGDDPRYSILGANRLPKDVGYTDARVSRELKRRYIEHAERDVIYAAAKEAFDTHGAILYAPWFACCDCARAIIGAGIREVVGLAILQTLTPPRWSGELAAAHQMLGEAGVGMRWITASVGETILFDGKEIEV